MVAGSHTTARLARPGGGINGAAAAAGDKFTMLNARAFASAVGGEH